MALNTARFDATKHLATPVVGDARESLVELSALLGDWSAPQEWTDHGTELRRRLGEFIAGRVADDGAVPLSYAQVVGALHRAATAEDYVTAAGGLPGELNVNWPSKSTASFDCEYGFSCMGYETAGAWGDNAGFAVIERLQKNQGGASYNNMLRDARGPHSDVRVDFVAHATRASSIAELGAALEHARTHDRTSVVVDVRESDWTEGGLFWQVGVPEVSELDTVREARAVHEAGMASQRRGV